MTILQNAIDAIELGVEDFASDNPKRLMSATRNFFAGLLLLFKHKLSELSAEDDEALIKRDVVPVLDDGQVMWKGKGKKTVDVHQIRERFASLGIGVDWDKLESLQQYRNDIEHYHAGTKPETVREFLVDGFLIARDFIREHLGADPQDVLGQKVWDRLIEEEKVFEAEHEACTQLLDSLSWPGETARKWVDDATCSQCGSQLIRPIKDSGDDAADAQYECAVCKQIWDFEQLITMAGTPHDTYRLGKSGIQAVGICPECGIEAYDAVDDECAYCGASGPHKCLRCGMEIPTEELDYDNGDLCGWCAHMSQKDD